MREFSLSKSEIVVLTTGLISLFLIIIIFQRSAFGDETYYLANVSLLQKHGFSKEFLISLNGSAGPLFAFIHYILKPITHLQTPYIRLVSVAFLLGTLYFITAIVRLLKTANWRYSLYTMAVPMIYLVGGLALTEMPAMLFFTIGLFFTIKSTRQDGESPPVHSFMYAIIGSSCFCISILGRQPYIIAMLALPLLFLTKNFSIRNLLILLVAILFATVIPAYLFYIWKGLMPPSDAVFYTDSTGLGSHYRIDFFILCLFYFAVTMFLIAPRFYSFPKKNKFLIILGAYVLIALINSKLNILSYVPFLSVTQKIIPANLNEQLVANLSGSSIIFFSLYFLANCFIHIQNQQLPREFYFFILALILIAFSCSKITWGFSSRYAAQAIPLIVIIGSYFYKQSSFSTLRIIIGMLIGVVSLISYYLT